MGKPINGNALRRLVGSGRPSSLMSVYKALAECGKVQLPTAQQRETQIIESHDLPIEIKDELDAGLLAITSMITRCNDIAHHVVEQRLNKATQEAKDARIAAETAIADAEENESKAWDEVYTVQLKFDEVQELSE
ncbi:hypothetical protein CTM88_17800 [Photobacterium aquimaris]|uniref:Uncharacterized protein n=1 Tax=Photobacterium aquimaris TaxID=512643 RepID=A0A2T3IFX2_9GAMM|nr:hypothetical protein CTM88_17800 [Photobacterium aquimaris]